MISAVCFIIYIKRNKTSGVHDVRLGEIFLIEGIV